MSIVARHRPPDSRIERKIITSMIVSDAFLQQVQAIYREDSLKLKYTRIVANWCIEYYKEFKKSPKQHIEDLFRQKTKINFPEEQANEIEDFLHEISEEYEDSGNLNVEYLLQQTEHHFRLSSLDNLKVNLSKALISGKAEEAESLVKNYERIVRESTKGVDLFRDTSSLIQTFGDQINTNKILRLPGDLGRSIDDLCRGHLVTFVGNSGVGKSWWLSQIAWWCAMEGYDVLYVSFEMMQSQVQTRVSQWMTGEVKLRHAGNIYIPRFDCKQNIYDTCHLRYRTCNTGLIQAGKLLNPENYPEDYIPCNACDTWYTMDNIDTSFKVVQKKGLNLELAMRAANKFNRFYKRAGQFKFVQFPPKSKSIDDLKVYMQNLEDYEGFVPSVVVTDYATKMRPARFHQKQTEDIANIFQEHKGLAQEKNILVVTGHQGNTARDGKDLKSGNWADGIGGLHESDVSIMINRNDKNKLQGLYRLSPGKVRDDEFNNSDQIYVTHNLKIGRPYLDSKMISYANWQEKDK